MVTYGGPHMGNMDLEKKYCRLAPSKLSFTPIPQGWGMGNNPAPRTKPTVADHRRESAAPGPLAAAGGAEGIEDRVVARGREAAAGEAADPLNLWSHHSDSYSY